MKAYICSNSESQMDDIDGVYMLVTEDGELLYTHFCSNKSYAYGDLWGSRLERQNGHPELEVLYLGTDDMTGEELVKRNNKNFAGKGVKEGNSVSVKIE